MLASRQGLADVRQTDMNAGNIFGGISAEVAGWHAPTLGEVAWGHAGDLLGGPSKSHEFERHRIDK